MQGLEGVSEREGGIGFGDAEEFVVFGDAVGAGHGASFDLAGAEADDEVGDGGVFGFARAVGDDGGEAVLFGEVDGADCFGEGADLVDFDEDRVAGFFVDSFLEEFWICDEEVIADDLEFVSGWGADWGCVRVGGRRSDWFAELGGEVLPAGPIVLGEAVFD